MSLRAPIAVTVEVRAAGRRVFRLAANVGEDGLALERPAPFERGRPVEIAFAMPQGTDGMALPAQRLALPTQRLALHARVEAGAEDSDEEGDREGRSRGGRELAFLSIGEDDRRLLRDYVAERLGLPPIAG